MLHLRRLVRCIRFCLTVCCTSPTVNIRFFQVVIRMAVQSFCQPNPGARELAVKHQLVGHLFGRVLVGYSFPTSVLDVFSSDLSTCFSCHFPKFAVDFSSKDDFHRLLINCPAYRVVCTNQFKSWYIHCASNACFFSLSFLRSTCPFEHWCINSIFGVDFVKYSRVIIDKIPKWDSHIAVGLGDFLRLSKDFDITKRNGAPSSVL